MKSISGLSKNQSSTMLGKWEAFFDLSGWWRVQGNHWKTQGRSWRHRLRRLCLVSWGRRSVPTSRGKPTTKPKVPIKSKRQSMHACMHACIVEAHASTRQRLGIHSTQRSRGSHRGERVQFVESLQLGAPICCYAPSDEKIQMRKQQWAKKGRSSKSCQRGNWPK